LTAPPPPQAHSGTPQRRPDGDKRAPKTAVGERHPRVFPLISRLKATWLFFTDTSAPVALKLAFALAFVYILLPVDAVPDLVPIFGWLDDLGVAAVAVAFLLRTISPYRQESSAESSGEVEVVDTSGVEIR
jgi:uncharacterized membrane protein YkvA (DUF1232 family)